MEGFLLYDFLKVIPDADIYGIDISSYAINNSKPEIRNLLQVCNATSLPWDDNTFDLVISINTMHNLHAYDLELALKEMERVGKQHKYLCVEIIETKLKKQIFCIGRSPAKPSTLPKSGIGGSSKPVIQAIIPSSTSSNSMAVRPTTTQAAILVAQQKPLVVDTIELPKNLDVGQVLVELKCSGICGSQLGEIDGVKGPDRYLPHLMGHEGFARCWRLARSPSRQSGRQRGAALAPG